MPIYEYECLSCGETFEEFVSVNKEPEGVACLKCGSKKTKKKFSVFSTCGCGCDSHSAPSGGGGGFS